MPGPEGLRRPWDTGAAGRGAPGLIGDPGNNESWEAGGLIGPGSGLAFVWDSTARFLQPNSGSQLGPSAEARGRLREGTVRLGVRGEGGMTLQAALGARGLSRPWSITPPHPGRCSHHAVRTRPQTGRSARL